MIDHCLFNVCHSITLFTHSRHYSSWKLFWRLTLEVKAKATCCASSATNDSLRPPWTVAIRLLCPLDLPGKNTGVGCHFLLQRIFPTQVSFVSCIGGRILYPWATWESQRPHTINQFPTKKKVSRVNPLVLQRNKCRPGSGSLLLGGTMFTSAASALTDCHLVGPGSDTATAQPLSSHSCQGGVKYYNAGPDAAQEGSWIMWIYTVEFQHKSALKHFRQSQFQSKSAAGPSSSKPQLHAAPDARPHTRGPARAAAISRHCQPHMRSQPAGDRSAPPLRDAGLSKGHGA